MCDACSGIQVIQFYEIWWRTSSSEQEALLKASLCYVSTVLLFFGIQTEVKLS